MKLKLFCNFFAVLLVLVLFSCQENNQSDGEDYHAGHPRILLPAGKEQTIKDQIETSPTWAQMHQAIINECETILQMEPRERIQTGRRLLGTSREYLRRIFYLSYAYRMTGYDRFAHHAEQEMLKAAGFSDWNPSHFLDVGEMTMALAIGYDWLFDELSEESKEKIREAIVNKGLEPSFNEDYNWFLDAEHNWNQVCNAGMTYGALAVHEDYPDLAKTIIDRAFETIPKAMHDYRPDGAYPEGYGYWGYGTTFNIMFLSAVEKALGTDHGLSEFPGFLETAGFLQNMLAPSSDCYNWGDCGSGGSLKPAMFWFAERNNNPSLLWMEKKFLQTDDYSEFTGNRLLPAIMIWGKDINLENIDPPEDEMWVGQGKNPVALMRTSWTNPDAIYLGFKVGSPSVNHGHMDIGSFIMEADGERWAADLGSQNYQFLESKGMSIFGRTQDAERWTIFRLNNYPHNTLTVNNELQRVEGYAKIDKFSDNEDFMFAVSDISTLYNGQMKKAVRGVGIKDQQFVVIRDELETLAEPAEVRWNMLTPANVELGSKEATLTLNGKKLQLVVKGPDNIEMKTWSTAPTTDYDAENPGTVRVGFTCKMPANSAQMFEVLLVPEDAASGAAFTDKKLEDW
ncbi:MAG: heparinase II/III domain-containing protein [Prolixibacteraceae bacterium]